MLTSWLMHEQVREEHRKMLTISIIRRRMAREMHNPMSQGKRHSVHSRRGLATAMRTGCLLN